MLTKKVFYAGSYGSIVKQQRTKKVSYPAGPIVKQQRNKKVSYTASYGTIVKQ